MPKQEKSDLFDFTLSRVKETQKGHLDGEPQAFGRWFAGLFFMSPRDIFVSDGSKDGKIDPRRHGSLPGNALKTDQVKVFATEAQHVAAGRAAFAELLGHP